MARKKAGKFKFQTYNVSKLEANDAKIPVTEEKWEENLCVRQFTMKKLFHD